jgi:hypothetical protein
VLRGDVVSRCLGVRSNVSVSSEAGREGVAEVIELAKRGCFAEALIQAPVSVETALTINGVRE